jgi:FKBP-type peptidyl-prolyl cis-trans isomerase SlyD
MKIARGLSVRIEYQLKVKGGDVIESSVKSGPLTYVHGDGKMLPGLEKRLEGLTAGDERKGEIPAREAFGTEEQLPIKQMRRADFPAGVKLKAGLTFEAKTPDGGTVTFKVASVKGDEISVRLLHPLVGRDIEFKVKVLAVQDPKAAPPLPPGVVELDLEELKDS